MTGSQGVTYTYNTTHGLVSIKDPLGHTPVRTDYDAQGRMTDHVDAFGNIIHYAYNLAANSESVTDRAGKPVSYVWDNRGNVIQKMEFLNGVPQVSVYTYDSFDNKTSEQLPGAMAPTTFLYQDTNNPPNPRLLTLMRVPNPNGVANLTTSYTFDAQGHVTNTTDARNIQTNNTYDPKGNLSTSQVTGFPASTYSYDANGNLIREINPKGCETDYVRDQFGNLTVQTVAVGQPEQLITTFTYDANGNELTETKQNTSGSQTTTYHPDAKGRVAETDYPDGTNILNVYDSFGHLVGTQDQNLRNKTIFYDGRNQPATVVYAFDNTREISGYDANGRPATVTDRGGRTAITKYDDLGRAATVTYQDGSRKITQYDGQGRVTDSIDENGNDTHNTYDDAGRRLSTTTGYGTLNAQETDYTVDADGNMKTVTVAGRPYITGMTYNNLNLVTETDYADGTHTTTEYDNVGNKTAFVDQAGKRIEYQRNCGGAFVEVRQITSGGTFSTDYKMDAAGNPVTQIDANNHATSYSWSNMNRRTSRRLPDGRMENYTSFDGVGNLTAKTDFASNSFTYGYDQNDHLANVTGPGVSQGYIFDAAMFRVVMNDASGSTTFNHDERNRETKRISPLGTYNYTPHLAGGVEGISSTNTNGTNLAYGYDSLNRAATVVEGVNTTFLHYDTVGNLDKMTLPNGVTVTQGYDTLNRLNAVTVVNGGGVIGRYNYSLGAAGNRTGVNEFTGRQVTWTPDDLYRLTSELIFNDPATMNNGTLGYVYDPVGNRNQRTSSVSIIGTQNFTGGYDPADELKPTFNFDQNGNQTTDGVFTYQYNSLKQLTRVTGTGVDLSYLYDGDGLRVQKTNNLTAVTTKYFWDDQNPTGVPQVLEELEGGSVVRRYVYGPNGPLYQVALVGSMWVTSYYGRDAQSIRFLMDASGNVTDSLTWDSYGRLLSRTGTTPLFLGYQNEYTEPETGLVYLRARWYNPDQGRFMGMDSFEGNSDDPISLHKYQAFRNNGVDFSDPSGNDSNTVGSAETRLLQMQFLPGETSTITVNIWSFRGKGEAWGHASLDVNRFGKHISWWPMDTGRTPILPVQTIQRLEQLNTAFGALRNVYTAPAFQDQTFQKDVAYEGQPPDIQIDLPGLQEQKIVNWWNTFKTSHKWSTLTQNCSTTVGDALHAGNAQVDLGDTLKGYNFPWTPGKVENYANAIKKHSDGL